MPLPLAGGQSAATSAPPARRSGDAIRPKAVISGGPSHRRDRRDRDRRPLPPKPARGIRIAWIIAAVLAALNLAGAPYYLLVRAERVRSPMHPWLKPSGYIGQSAGLLAVAVFGFLWLYPLRKKFRWLAWTGRQSFSRYTAIPHKWHACVCCVPAC